MATSPLLGGERAAQRPAGTGTDVLGPSDSSDSGSDVIGADAEIGDANIDSDSDRFGTGERTQAGLDTARRDAPDIAPDHIEGDPSGARPDIDQLAVDTETPGDPDAAEGDVEGDVERGERERRDGG